MREASRPFVVETPPPCAGCGSEEPCADHDGRSLCYACWHRAREAEPPFVVRRASDGFVRTGICYLEREAIVVAQEMTEASARANAFWVAEGQPNVSPAETWEPHRVDRWSGDRVAHPGYMARRRAAIGGMR